MPRKKKLKLSDLQEAALLYVGGKQVLGKECVRFGSTNYGYYNDASTSGSIRLRLPDRGSNYRTRNPLVPVKTFRALEKRGVMDLSVDGRKLTAKLTKLGWERFGVLAAESQATVDAYDAKVEAIRTDADSKGSTWEIEISQERMIKQTRTHDYTVFAKTKAEAEAEAWKKHLEEMADKNKYGGWWQDNEYANESPGEAEAFVENMTQIDQNTDEDDTPGGVATRNYKYENKSPPRFSGVREFVLDKQMPAELIPGGTVNLARFRNMLKDDRRANAKKRDGDEVVEAAPTVNMDRFSFMREDG